MQRERFLTHIGFGGHYALNVQVKPNLVNESIKVEEPDDPIETTFTHVTQKNFEQADYIQDPSAAGKEQYHHALESVLKLGVIENAEKCIKQHSNEEFSDLSKQIRNLRQKIRKNKFENSKVNRSMMYYVSHKAIATPEKQSDACPRKPATPAMYKESPRKKLNKATVHTESELTIENNNNTIQEPSTDDQQSEKSDREGDSTKLSFDEDQSIDRKENSDIRIKREEIKSIAMKLSELTKQNNNIPDVNNEVAIKLLEKGHPNLEKLMKDLLKARMNKLTDETRLQLEETILLVNGFNALDTNSDGLLTAADIHKYLEKRHYNLSVEDIQESLWLIDDQRRGYLTLDDIKQYSNRINKIIIDWIPIHIVTEQFLIVDNQATDRKPSKMVKIAIAILKKTAIKISLSFFLYRLLLSAALENQQHQLHLLSALQQLVERFGTAMGEVKFEVLFCKSAFDLQDADAFSLAELLKFALEWETKFQPYSASFTPRDKSDIYTHTM